MLGNEPSLTDLRSEDVLDEGVLGDEPPLTDLILKMYLTNVCSVMNLL